MKISEAISLIVPTRNEGEIIEVNLKLISDYLSKSFEKYEIVVSDFSEDRTPELVNDLSKKYPIKYVYAGEKGIGIGIRKGIEAAKNDLVMFYPADMSWNISCIRESFIKILSNDGKIILCSRGYINSIVTRTLKRKILTKIYNTLVNLLFGLNISDTQCTVAFRKSDIIPFIDRLDSKTAFFQTQILIYSKKNNLKIIEIPAVVNDVRRDSKINMVGDSFLMFKDLINEFARIKFG